MTIVARLLVTVCLLSTAVSGDSVLAASRTSWSSLLHRSRSSRQPTAHSPTNRSDIYRDAGLQRNTSSRAKVEVVLSRPQPQVLPLVDDFNLYYFRTVPSPGGSNPEGTLQQSGPQPQNDHHQSSSTSCQQEERCKTKDHRVPSSYKVRGRHHRRRIPIPEPINKRTGPDAERAVVLNHLPPTANKRKGTLLVHFSVPVYKGSFSETVGGHFRPDQCVRCPSDQTVALDGSVRRWPVSVPPVQVCPQLTRTPGKVHVAVTSGPTPGTMVTEGNYHMEVLVWKGDRKIQICDYRLTVLGRPPLESKCKKPPEYSSSLVICNTKDKNSSYPTGTICQYFCTPGYMLSHKPGNGALVVCRGDTWTSSHPIKCVPTQCRQPEVPANGYLRCTSNMSDDSNRYQKGTICQYHCEVGYVIPTSQLDRSIIRCDAPLWNSTAVLGCKQIVPPKPYCEDQTLQAGEAVEIKNPVFLSSSSKSLDVKCTVPKGLPVGEHTVYCEANDPELRVSTSCSFKVNVKVAVCSPPPVMDHGGVTCRAPKGNQFIPSTVCEYSCEQGYAIPLRQQQHRFLLCTSRRTWNSTVVPQCVKLIPPQPHPRECRNQTVVVKDGLARVKKPKFVSSSGRPLKVTCHLEGDVAVGQYVNYCRATDPELGLTGKCRYFLKVKANECSPPKDILHGTVKCDTIQTYPPGTVCHYDCDEGYVVLSRQMKRKVHQCLPHLKWNSTLPPKCNRAVPPHPHPEDCRDQTLLAKKGEARLKKPRFYSERKKLVKVKCTLGRTVTVGQFDNYCVAVDTELRTNSSCNYSVTVTAPECPPPRPTAHGDVICDGVNPGTFPEDTVCEYGCRDGFVVPTSQLSRTVHRCLRKLSWNSTGIPQCQKVIPPRPHHKDCRNQTLISKGSSIKVRKPRFTLSNGKPAEVKCTLEGQQVGVGRFVNLCEATDPELRVTASCSYTITVKALECQAPPNIANGQVTCIANVSGRYPPFTVCTYTCDKGFVITTKQMHLTSRLCLPRLKWNTTLVPSCQEATPPRPTETSCADREVEVPSLTDFVLEPPVFLTRDQLKAEVVCSSLNTTAYTTYKVSCNATDPQLRTSATCTYRVTLKAPDVLKQECQPLRAPTNGYIICKPTGSKFHCEIKCKDGYTFPTGFSLLHRGYVECNTLENLWDFQKEYGVESLPDCLGELPTTSLQVSVKFNSKAENCLHFVNEEHLRNIAEDMLLTKNTDFCKNITCSDFVLTCTTGSDTQRDILEAAWILKTSFIPEDYEDTDDVPPAEILIDSALSSIQRTVSADGKFREDLLSIGIEVQQDSFRQSRFTLVCERRGYEVDPATNKCVECPSGHFESTGKCHQCPKNYYQDRTGQTICKPCPRTSFSGDQSTSLSPHCKATAVVHDSKK